MDITIGTLSKAIGSEGGFACGNKDIIDYLKNKARSFIFSTALSPAVINGAIKSLEIIETSYLTKKLNDNIKYMCEGLRNIGFDIDCESPIIPIHIGNEALALKFSEMLLDNKIFIPAIRFPTVPLNKAILRMTLMATHSYEDIDLVLSKINEISKILNIKSN